MAGQSGSDWLFGKDRIQMSDSYVISNITKRYSRKQVLSEISMECRAGECVGIVGTNGIGKSTLLRVMAGVEKPDRGDLLCLGHNLLRERGAFARLIAYVPQENPLLGELTARDNLKLWSGRRMSGWEKEIRMLKLDEIIDLRVSAMSGGMKRRLAIACALTGGSPVLIMDEPTAALDLYHKGIIFDYLRSYLDNGGMVIFSTHDMEEMRFADHLCILHDGRISETSVEDAVDRIRSGAVS